MYKRQIVTNCHPDPLSLKLQRTGLDSRVDNIISSHQLGKPKEDPAFWQDLAGHLPAVEVSHIDDLDRLVVETGYVVGIVATPAGAAQDVVDRLVAAGVRSILNFAPALVEAEAGVEVRKVDLATELQILRYYERHRSPAGRRRRAVG